MHPSPAGDLKASKDLSKCAQLGAFVADRKLHGAVKVHKSDGALGDNNNEESKIF